MIFAFLSVALAAEEPCVAPYCIVGEPQGPEIKVIATRSDIVAAPAPDLDRSFLPDIVVSVDEPPFAKEKP